MRRRWRPWIAVSQAGLLEREVEIPSHALGVRHHREHVARLVADPRGIVHGAVGGVPHEAEGDAAFFFKAVEVGVRWANVEGTKVSLTSGLRSFADVLLVRWYQLTGRYR